jgi:hypothetical protein
MSPLAIQDAAPLAILPVASALPGVAAALQRRTRLDSRSVALAFALAGCSGHADAGAEPTASVPQVIGASDQGSQSTATITGVRISTGDAVNCAEIRSDDGTVHPVSGLNGDIAIGARITATGFYGVSTRCVGRVLIITDIKRL